MAYWVTVKALMVRARIANSTPSLPLALSRNGSAVAMAPSASDLLRVWYNKE